MIRDYNHTRVPVVFHKETLEFMQLLGLNLKQLLAHVVMTEQNSWKSTPAQQMNTAKCVSLSTHNILGESEKSFLVISYSLLFIEKSNRTPSLFFLFTSSFVYV